MTALSCYKQVTGRHRLKSALSSFEGILLSIRNPAYAGKPKRSGSNPDSRLLFTENYTEEIQRKSIVNAKAFTSLRSIHWETDGKKNRIDFPKQIRIKRKYLKSRDDDFREKP